MGIRFSLQGKGALIGSMDAVPVVRGVGRIEGCELANRPTLDAQ
jgi:hypothetical protein